MTRVLFVLTLFALLLIRDAVLYLPIILVLWLISGSTFVKINKRVLLSILLFNSAVSIGYLIMAYLQHFSAWEYLCYINLKVYTSTFFVILFFDRVNVVQFFSFSQTLSYLLTLTLGMVYSYIKTFESFKFAVRARGGIEDMGFLKRVSAFFFEKAMHDSKERALAMRARGFFDD